MWSSTAANNLYGNWPGDFALKFLVDSGTLGPGHGGNVTLTAKNIDMESMSINTGDVHWLVVRRSSLDLAAI